MAHDLRLLLLRVARQETLWEDAGGGSVGSNVRLAAFTARIGAGLPHDAHRAQLDAAMAKLAAAAPAPAVAPAAAATSTAAADAAAVTSVDPSAAGESSGKAAEGKAAESKPAGSKAAEVRAAAKRAAEDESACFLAVLSLFCWSGPAWAAGKGALLGRALRHAARHAHLPGVG